MNGKVMLRMLFCLAVFTVYLYHIVHKQNTLNHLSMQIPKETLDLKVIEEQNVRLRFLIDSFESPDHLMQLAHSPQYAHLRHPVSTEVLHIAQGSPLHSKEVPQGPKVLHPFKLHPVLAVGANR